VKFNKIGIPAASGLIPLALRRKFGKSRHYDKIDDAEELPGRGRASKRFSTVGGASTTALPVVTVRKTVLIATMEYDIEDWQIKIKIGGLGVMAQLVHTRFPSFLM